MNIPDEITAKKNTHLLEWLPEGVGHCQRGSKEWASGYLLSAKEYIEALEEFITALPVDRPVAWTSQAQLDRMQRNPGGNHIMWGEPLPYHNDIPLFSRPQSTEAAARDGWMPIETAPKDRTKILAVEALLHVWEDDEGNEKSRPGDCEVVFWSERAEGWIGFGLVLSSFAPTHWMPLPDSPTLIEV